MCVILFILHKECVWGFGDKDPHILRYLTRWKCVVRSRCIAILLEKKYSLESLRRRMGEPYSSVRLKQQGEISFPYWKSNPLLQQIFSFSGPSYTELFRLTTSTLNFGNCMKVKGTAVAQLLRCCATNRKVAVLIPAGVIGIFHLHKILPIALWSWGRLSF